MKPPESNGNNKIGGAASRRRSLLELAPLELRCMNALWPIGEGTVREIRDLLAPNLPRAYTTIMTIMDRLARKGIVERRKSGRAYIYRPCLSVEEARSHALGQVVEGFFGGSREIAAAYLGNGTAPDSHPQTAAPAKAAAAVASAVTGRAGRDPVSARPPDGQDTPAVVKQPEAARTKSPADAVVPIDATLL